MKVFTGVLPLCASLASLVAGATSMALDGFDFDTENVHVKRQTSPFGPTTIYSPPGNYKSPAVLYPRAVELPSGALLATWENYSPEPPYFPVYQSTDGGRNWHELSRVEDRKNGWGMRWQPTLFVLPEKVGEYPAGTILCAGDSIPADLSQSRIDVYASRDNGTSWTFVSNVAAGRGAQPGSDPVWEPHFEVYNGQLICFYSDERDPRYGQKLTHQTTTDLINWSATKDDAVVAGQRPGMTALTKLPNGQYIFLYEICGGSSSGCPVSYRLISDPTNALPATAYTLTSNRGTRANAGPYVVWSSVGGANGAIILSTSGSGSIFVNRDLGAPGSTWTEYDVQQPGGYSRGLMLFREDDSKMLMISAGHNSQTAHNQVVVSVVDLRALLGV